MVGEFLESTSTKKEAIDYINSNIKDYSSEYQLVALKVQDVDYPEDMEIHPKVVYVKNGKNNIFKS